MEVGGNRWLFLYTYYYAVLYVSIQWMMMLGIYSYVQWKNRGLFLTKSRCFFKK